MTRGGRPTQLQADHQLLSSWLRDDLDPTRRGGESAAIRRPNRPNSNENYAPIAQRSVYFYYNAVAVAARNYGGGCRASNCWDECGCIASGLYRIDLECRA